MLLHSALKNDRPGSVCHLLLISTDDRSQSSTWVRALRWLKVTLKTTTAPLRAHRVRTRLPSTPPFFLVCRALAGYVLPWCLLRAWCSCVICSNAALFYLL